MDPRTRTLRFAAEEAERHLEAVDERPVAPPLPPDLPWIDDRLPDDPIDPVDVVRDLVAQADRGLTATPGGRYFGFVTGGALPAALAADWLVSAWDQNAFSFLSSPAASAIERVAAAWTLDVLGLPADASVAFVTGCQMAHVTALAAARHEVLLQAGWNVANDGLSGAPAIAVVAGQARHVTVDRALRLLGLGEAALRPVAVDDQARLLPEALEAELATISGPCIVVLQAGEVNTGAFDPMIPAIGMAHDHGAWVHVDGAFGLWARASNRRRHLVDGVEAADSWAFDAHKWLNVPYDSGIAVTAHPRAHRAAMAGAAAYLLPTPEARDAYDWTPDASRRARGIPVYAAMRSLGRSGIADLVDRCCDHATHFARALAELPGVEILNDVVLNQVLFRVGNAATTEAVLGEVQRSGEAWMGSTLWRGEPAIRISVSSWRTTSADVDRTVAAFRTAIG